MGISFSPSFKGAVKRIGSPAGIRQLSPFLPEISHEEQRDVLASRNVLNITGVRLTA